MIADILTVAWKEVRELPYFRKDKSRTNLFSLVIFLGVYFGILLPIQTGVDWVRSPVSMFYWAPFRFYTMTGTNMVDAFAGERERHTLENLLASRLSDRAILLGKILAGFSDGMAITTLCIAVGLVTVNIAHGQGGLLFYPATIALGILAIMILLSTLGSGLGFWYRCGASSVRQAQQTFTIAYFVLFIPLLIFPMLPATMTQPINRLLE